MGEKSCANAIKIDCFSFCAISEIWIDDFSIAKLLKRVVLGAVYPCTDRIKVRYFMDARDNGGAKFIVFGASHEEIDTSLYI